MAARETFTLSVYLESGDFFVHGYIQGLQSTKTAYSILENQPSIRIEDGKVYMLAHGINRLQLTDENDVFGKWFEGADRDAERDSWEAELGAVTFAELCPAASEFKPTWFSIVQTQPRLHLVSSGSIGKLETNPLLLLKQPPQALDCSPVEAA